ncbi:hypothetical protein [Bifidobacterium adolescentis]
MPSYVRAGIRKCARIRALSNMACFATMIYLTCGKLDLKAVTTA